MSALQHFRAPDGLAPGPGYSHAVTGRGRWVMRPPFVGYGVRAALERTWGSGASDAHGNTYVGLEGAFGVAQVGVRLGVGDICIFISKAV